MIWKHWFTSMWVKHRYSTKYIFNICIYRNDSVLRAVPQISNSPVFDVPEHNMYTRSSNYANGISVDSPSKSSLSRPLHSLSVCNFPVLQTLQNTHSGITNERYEIAQLLSASLWGIIIIPGVFSRCDLLACAHIHTEIILSSASDYHVFMWLTNTKWLDVDLLRT